MVPPNSYQVSRDPDSITVVDAKTGRLRLTLPAGNWKVSNFEFSPNDRYLLVGFGIKLFVEMQFKKVADEVTTLATGWDAVRLWDVESAS